MPKTDIKEPRKILDDYPEIMKVEDVAEYMQYCLTKAYEVFKWSDFPAIDGTKRVHRESLREWIRNRERKVVQFPAVRRGRPPKTEAR